MTNNSNSNSYLILYLIIILVLLYAITFMSSYTCSPTIQITDTFKPKEKFESGSSGDFTIVAVGYANQLYTQTITNNGQSGWVDGSAVAVPNSQSVTEVCGLSDGSFVGVGLNSGLYTRSSLTSTWVPVNNTSMKFAYITQQTDGSFLATGTDSILYRLETLTSWPYKVHDPELGKVIQLQDKSYLAVGGGGLDTLYTMDPWFANMKQITHDNTATKITYVQQGPDGTIYGLLNGNTFAKKNLADLTNESIPWTNLNVCCFSAFSIIQTSSQHTPGTTVAPPLTIGDYTLLGVGYANQIYIQDIIGGVTYPNSPALQNSQTAVDISVFPNGSVICTSTDYKLYTKKTLNSSWVNCNIIGYWNAVSVANDGHTLILVGKDTNIYTADFNNPSTPASLVDNTHFVLKVIQLQNGELLAIGTDTHLYTGSGSLNPYNINWTPVQTNYCCAKSVAQAPDGSIVILDTNGKIQTSPSVGGAWSMSQACCFSAIAVMQINPQTINGYTRMGAFQDDSSRTIPNFLGSFNTLPECVNSALSQGYNTVGYQYMNQCFGGKDSPYDRIGFQTDNTKSASAYPGAYTNIVYKTNQEMVTSNDPIQGEVFVYQACQFTGSGSKMTTGQFPNMDDSIDIKSIKLGPKTDLILYAQPNYQGASSTYNSYSDIVSKDAACIDFTFSSAKVIINQNAPPEKPANLTNAQLANLWTQAGCKAESMGFNATNINNWKKKNALSDIITDMKNWATSTNPEMKQGCYTLSPQPNVPGEGEVVLFENCDFGGAYKKYGLGDVTFVGNDFNDITSSIKIGPFTSLTIYENSSYGGKSLSWKNASNTISVINCLTANNFNDMLSSLKVASSTVQVNNSLSLQASPVITLGPWNPSPWNMSTFVDQTAKWIWWNNWNGKYPNGPAPVDPKPVRFQLLVPVSSKTDIPVTIHVIADNAPQGTNFVKVNNNLAGQIEESGWTTPNYTQLQTDLSPGNNLVEFDVQNTGGGAGLLVSIINSDTYEVVANSGNGRWGWVDPSIVVTSLMADAASELAIHDEAAKGKIVKINDLKEIPQFTVGGVFRLPVNLKSVPPYIKGQQYVDGDVNQFYLSIEKLDPNCQIESENNCLNAYVDNKKCTSSPLSNASKQNAYRLVIVSKDYVLDPDIPFGKNVDFTLVKIGDNLYLKNIQTGYMPKLFKNDAKQDLYGYMDTGYLSNYNSLKTNVNRTCGNAPVQVINENVSNEQSLSNKNQQFIKCYTNADGLLYLMTTTNIVESNPLKFVLNKDGTVSISLETFNTYGNVDKTYSLVFCKFNVDTYAFIEKLTNPLGTFFINMVCFDSDEKRKLPNNTLNFNFEISKFPEAYIKQKNIYNLNN
jgi:hypothetical protein